MEDGEDMGFFVKNVENVQGDERDVIIFSSTFGRNSQGTFRRAFGVLGQTGGERRLNVAVSRAREKVILVTSMPINEVSDLLATRRTATSPRDFLQAYLEYARTLTSGEFDNTRALLTRLTAARTATGPGGLIETDGTRTAVARFIRQDLGRTVSEMHDDGAFGLDFAITDPRTGLYGIGIECDAPLHPLLRRARAREMWRPSVLRRAVPVLHRVSSHGWYHDRAREQQRLRAAIDQALTKVNI
jgi:primosomal replication protein N''